MVLAEKNPKSNQNKHYKTPCIILSWWSTTEREKGQPEMLERHFRGYRVCSIFISVNMLVWQSPYVRQKKTHTVTFTHAQRQQKKTQAWWLTIFNFYLSALVSSSECLFWGCVLIKSLCCDELRGSKHVCVSACASPPFPMACRCPARRWGRWLWPQRS